MRVSATFRGFFAVPDYDTRALIPAAVRAIFIGLVILIWLDFDDVIEVFYSSDHRPSRRLDQKNSSADDRKNGRNGKVTSLSSICVFAASS